MGVPQMIAADLLRVQLALGYRLELHEGRLAVAPPDGAMAPRLRDRIIEQREHLKALLKSPDPLAACSPVDQELIDIDRLRFSRERLTEFIAMWLGRYVETGYAPFIEIAAWFAAAHDTNEKVGKETNHPD
jgi:hypothetical protein